MTPKFIRDEFGENARVTGEINGFVLSVGADSFWIRSEVKSDGIEGEVELEFPVRLVDVKDRPLLKEGAVVVLRTVDTDGNPGAEKLALSFVMEERSENEIEAAEEVGRKLAEKLGWIDGGMRHDR